MMLQMHSDDLIEYRGGVICVCFLTEPFYCLSVRYKSLWMLEEDNQIVVGLSLEEVSIARWHSQRDGIIPLHPLVCLTLCFWSLRSSLSLYLSALSLSPRPTISLPHIFTKKRMKGYLAQRTSLALNGFCTRRIHRSTINIHIDYLSL